MDEATNATCPHCDSALVVGQRFCGHCGASLAIAIEESPPEPRGVGQVLDGRYRLTYLIGRGGMGSVYRAEVVGLGTVVAVKILHPTLSADSNSRRRFENEARLASQINHPNSVSILDFHTSPTLTYLVMEYLIGESLREVLHQVGNLGVQRAIHITRQLLSALEASHALNVLHRDLKPDNIYLIARQDSLDFVKVLDFGMAISGRPGGQDRITSVGQVCGTPAYMSPEQVRGKELTVRSDLYSVGVILYECLTGANPFLGGNTADTLVNHLTKTPELPSKACKGANIPPYLDALVMQGLRKAQAERFESAGQFRKVLEALVLARRSEGEDNSAITTCPECGKPLLAGAVRCQACKHVLQETGLGPEAIKDILPQAMLDALEKSGVQGMDIKLSPTITSTTCPAVSWDPPLVGRTRELEAVDRFLDGTAPEGQQHFLRIIGRPGSGKGRLAREALHRAERDGWRGLWIEPEQQPVQAPLTSIRSAVARLLQLAEPITDDGELAIAAEQAGVDLNHQQGLLEIFGLAAAGKDPADVRRARRAEAWREVVRSAGRRGKVLLVFQELAQQDAPSRELIAALATADAAEGQRVRVIVTEDPDLFMLWPETLALSVPPLGQREAVALAAALLDRAAVQTDVERMAEASGGSPLMLLELARLAVLEPFSTPPKTLADVINRRIGQLPPKARMLLHAMAVLGRPTSPNTLVTIIADPGNDPASLNLLAEQGFLTVGERGYRLAHRTYREVAYATIPVAVRSILHLEAAKLALQASAPPAQVAHHLFEGGNHAGAVPHLLRAGLAALDALDDTLAGEYFNKVLRVMPPPPKTFDGSSKTWLSASLGLAAALADGGDLTAALHTLKMAAQVAGDSGWVEEQQRLVRRRDRLRKRLFNVAAATGPNLEALGALALASDEDDKQPAS